MLYHVNGIIGVPIEICVDADSIKEAKEMVIKGKCLNPLYNLPDEYEFHGTIEKAINDFDSNHAVEEA